MRHCAIENSDKHHKVDFQARVKEIKVVDNFTSEFLSYHSRTSAHADVEMAAVHVVVY